MANIYDTGSPLDIAARAAKDATRRIYAPLDPRNWYSAGKAAGDWLTQAPQETPALPPIQMKPTPGQANPSPRPSGIDAPVQRGPRYPMPSEMGSPSPGIPDSIRRGQYDSQATGFGPFGSSMPRSAAEMQQDAAAVGLIEDAYEPTFEGIEASSERQMRERARAARLAELDAHVLANQPVDPGAIEQDANGVYSNKPPSLLNRGQAGEIEKARQISGIRMNETRGLEQERSRSYLDAVALEEEDFQRTLAKINASALSPEQKKAGEDAAKERMDQRRQSLREAYGFGTRLSSGSIYGAGW